ncbi:MAG: LamG domain-containing protein, partial [Planctomycetota bacterium]
QPYALRLRADRKLQWRSNHSMNTPGTSPTSQTFLSTGQLAAGQWAHVAATWDGSNVRFYIDGVLDSTHTLTGTVGVTTEDSAIGSDIVDADEWFDGRIDDLRVYNRALSDTEVFELGGSGLRLHLKLDETSGTVADDSGPFIFDGDLIDGPEPGVEGVVDRAIRMNDNDANQERIEIPSTAVDGLTAMTVTWWMKTEKTGETAILTGATTSGSNPANSVLVYFRSHTEFSPWVDQSEAGRSTLSESLADGRWHHWAYTCDRAVGRYRLYRDAEEVATRTFTPRSGGFEVAPGGLFVAHDQDTLGGSFSPEQALVGDLDDFRIYGRVLDAEEIAELYGLIGHWRLDEIDGDTVAVDDTAFAHNGDYVRTPTLEEESPYPSETVRTAARMEPGDYLRIPNKDHLEVGKDDADFSIAYWLKNNREASGQWRETIKKHFDGRRRTFAMWLRPDDNRMHCRISTKHAWNEGTDTVSGFDPGVWRHMAYVKRGSELRLYVDGLFERADTLQGEVVSNNGDIYAGVRSTGWRNDVTLDDFRIYSRALNDWEVAELHGLVGWYRMEDLAGSVVTDSSGTANHGAVVGSTPSWPTDAREGLASIELDGTNYIDASNDWARGEGGGAVAAWGKLVQRDSGGSELVSLSNRLAIRLDLAWSGPQAALAFAYNGSGWQPINSGRSFEGGRWSHFAASYREDIRELSFYIDGVLVDTATLTGSPDFSAASLPIRIGQHAGSETVRNFTGLIDDVRVYNRPISRAEARGLYYGSQTPGLRIVRWSEVANP